MLPEENGGEHSFHEYLLSTCLRVLKVQRLKIQSWKDLLVLKRLTVQGMDLLLYNDVVISARQREAQIRVGAEEGGAGDQGWPRLSWGQAQTCVSGYLIKQLGNEVDELLGSETSCTECGHVNQNGMITEEWQIICFDFIRGHIQRAWENEAGGEVKDQIMEDLVCC